MPITVAGNLDYLLDNLRLHMGDTVSASYRYTDDWLRTALVASVETLMTWWNYKYLIDDDDDVYRNPDHTYLFTSPPIIQKGDERNVILMASIITKEGSLENAAWSLGSWRDAEISYSNIAGGKAKDNSLARDWNELKTRLREPNSRLATSIKGDLPGYKNNPHERSTKY